MYLYRDSPFQEASADFFTRLEIDDFTRLDVNFDVTSKSISIGTFARDEVVFQVFKAYGKAFEEVKFSAKKNSHRLYYAALMHCACENLRVIDLRIPEEGEEVMGVLCSILDKFGPQIEGLKLYGEVIPPHQVASFKESLNKCTKLRSLSIQCNWEILAVGFWEHIGRNLEYVQLAPAALSNLTAHKLVWELRKFCRRLRRIDILANSSSEALRLPYSLSFQTAFTAIQVSTLRVSRGNLDPLYLLASTNPEWVCKWDWTEKHLGSLLAFNDGLISCSVHFSQTVNLNTISNQLKTCAHLEKLRLGTGSGYENYAPLGNLKFHLPMLDLKLLALRDCCTFREFVSLVSTKHTPGVSELDVEFTDTIDSEHGAINSFQNINKYLPLLKHVKMAESRNATELMSEERKKERKALYEKLMWCFSKWRNLQKLVVCLGLSQVHEDELKAMHAPLTRKNVEVFLDFNHFFFGRLLIW